MTNKYLSPNTFLTKVQWQLFTWWGAVGHVQRSRHADCDVLLDSRADQQPQEPAKQPHGNYPRHGGNAVQPERQQEKCIWIQACEFGPQDLRKKFALLMHSWQSLEQEAFREGGMHFWKEIENPENQTQNSLSVSAHLGWATPGPHAFLKGHFPRSFSLCLFCDTSRSSWYYKISWSWTWKILCFSI